MIDLDNKDRRSAPPPKGECSKLDTFANIGETLKRLETKIDGLSKEMQAMIRLEQQVLEQSKDIEYIHNAINDLRKEKQAISERLTVLQKDHESQSKSLGNYERIAWAVATILSVIAGKYLFGIG
jgi:predicted  nucleic acid-binding Zn-ribbon protein